MDRTEYKTNKKIKDLGAVIVVLSGIAVGSFFVDGVQMLSGEGFSPRALRNAQVVESGDRTWVAYGDPKVTVMAFSSTNCIDCVTDEVIVWMKRLIPTIVVVEKNIDTEEGKKLAERYHIATLPAFVFDAVIADTTFFAQAETLFMQEDNQYVLNTTQLGVPVGKRIALPKDNGSITIGPKEASVTIVEFSDFGCESCKAVHQIIEQILKAYDGKIHYVFKHLSVMPSEQSPTAALAVACAHEQDAFLRYANILFSRQSQWTKVKDASIFERYGTELRLDQGKFHSCIVDEKYSEQITSDYVDADRFGVGETPTIFVNDEVKSDTVTYETLKSLVDKALKE